MDSPLDDLEYLIRVDQRGMLDVITTLPESAEEAIEVAEKVDLKIRPFRNLIVTGMGGSAVGGLLLRDWLQPTSRVPIVVSRDYNLPGFVGKDTLLFVVSYSGGTEETLSSFEDGREKGAKTVVFTSGGELEKRARSAHIPIFKMPSGFQPRAAIAHQFFSLVVAARKADIIQDSWWEAKEAISVLKEIREEMRPETHLKSNPAKRLAEELRSYIPFVYGSHIHEAVAYRWNTQLNENSKSPASHSFLPEAFHNAIMAGEADPKLLSKVCVICLLDPLEGEYLDAKTRRFINIIKPNFGKVLEVKARGEGRLARILSALYIGDYVSAYLGVLYGKDPSTVEYIDRLKRG
jgi:glucose/mannose-6-phosphate isomerase